MHTAFVNKTEKGKSHIQEEGSEDNMILPGDPNDHHDKDVNLPFSTACRASVQPTRNSRPAVGTRHGGEGLQPPPTRRTKEQENHDPKFRHTTKRQGEQDSQTEFRARNYQQERRLKV